MKADIISIGNELLAGHVINSNSVYIAKNLLLLGAEVSKIITVGDKINEIAETLRAAKDADIIVVTGGLGPTSDDLTRNAIAKFLGVELELNEIALQQTKSFFKKRHRPMHEKNLIQAYLPIGSIPLLNEVGTACGIKVDLPNGTKIYSIPGVPFEMKWMIERYILPDVKTKLGKKTNVYRFLKTIGIPESELFDLISDIVEQIKPDIDVSFLPHQGKGVSIGLTVKGKTQSEALLLIDSAQAKIQKRVGDSIYTITENIDESLENVISQMVTSSGKRIAVAESCTGGLLANILTDISGSSAYFLAGVTAYSNAVKSAVLNVPENMIKKCGAVSPQVAVAMAEGVRQLADSDLALSTTGIAGPSGGSEEKPVGLVYIGFADREKSYAKKFVFTGGRLYHKTRTIHIALNMLRIELCQQK